MNHPKKLGKYRIDAVLGEGAMGVVYQGYDPDIRRTVAIKTIRRELTDGSSHAAMIAARFRNEAQAAGRLSHPGIVAVYDYGEDGPVAFIAMEFVRGQSIARHLAGGVRFTDDDIPGLMSQLLDALDHAHAHGVWHRDIKPANVILATGARLKVADFGTARIQDVELTQAETMIGTPSYMAPEQFLGSPVDARTDVYGAGVLLYVLLTGRPPFTGGSTEALMYQVVHQAPRPPSQVDGAQRPHCYDGIVARALAKDPNDRYPGAAAFRRDLQAAVGTPIDAGGWEKTLVVATPARTSATEPRTSTTSSATAAPTGSATAVGATAFGWDRASLARVEASLARHVGPMATVLVKRAARECDTPTALVARLAEQITDGTARRDFLAQSGASEAAAVPTATATPSAGQPGDGRAGGGFGSAAAPPVASPLAATLDSAFIARTQQLLARHVGPIAGILVKKAAAAAIDRAGFIARAAAAVDDPATRARLIAELERLA